MIIPTRWRPLAFYSVAALAVLLPLLHGGFVLTLDMVFAPDMPFPDQMSASFVWHAAVSVLSYVLPADFVQKIILVSALLLAGISAHNFYATLQIGKSNLAPYFAGLLYILNPFVYSRFMAGQYAVLLGYALLLFFLRAWILFLREPGWRKAVAPSLWLVAISIVSIHTVGLAVLAAVCVGLASWWRRRKDTKWQRQALLGSGIIAGSVLLLSSYWLVPALLGYGKTAGAIAGFGTADLAAFATNAEGFGLLGNVLSLQGFWADTKSLYVVPMDMFSWWWLPWLAVWALVVFGIYKSWRAQRDITAALIGLIIVAAILAIGTAGTLAAPINEFLYKYIPFFAGYREPQKFVALIALAYAYFGAVGVASLADTVKQYWRSKFAPAAVLPVFTLPFLIAPLMLWGFNGQLAPRHYPTDWYAVNDYLQSVDPNAKVLFLPWHLYMRFDFADRVIANPAPKFFQNPIVISNDPEMDGAKSYATSRDQQELQARILPLAQRDSKELAANLLMLNIRYVVLAKELDYKQYGYIDRTGGMTLIKATDTLKLYKVSN
jgi:hypothetical protein